MNCDGIDVASITNANSTHPNYTYTALGELDVLQNIGVGNANISRYDYNYDARGVRTALQEQIEADPVKTLQFSYDPSNQLAGEAVTGGKAGEAYTADYEYDAAGNRTRYEKTDAQGSTLIRSSNNKLNQTTATRTTAYGVGSTSGLSYDEAGNIAQVNSTSGSSDYQFDDANRLKAMISRDASGVAQSKTEFVYDGNSMLRVSKTFTWNGVDWVAQSQKGRVYDGVNAVQERDTNGALSALYVRGQSAGGGIGGLLARVFDADTSFMHYDGHGNVVQLTNASGVVSGKYTYDAFGNTLSQTGGAAGLNPYRFSTKEAVGSLVYYGLRFYSPSLGKWLNRDPIEEIGGVNVYGFVHNNGINLIDSNGLLDGFYTIPGDIEGMLDSLYFHAEMQYLYVTRLYECLSKVLCDFYGWFERGAGGVIGLLDGIEDVSKAFQKLKDAHGKSWDGVKKGVRPAAQRALAAALRAALAAYGAAYAALAAKVALAAAGGILLGCSAVVYRDYFNDVDDYFGKGGCSR